MVKPLVIVATPCFGGMVSQPYMMAILKLTHRAVSEGVPTDVMLLGGDALISRARSTMVARFLRNPEATHLLFVDADISFEPEQVFRLLRFDQDVVAGLYPLKQVDWAKLPVRMLAGEPAQAAGLGYVGTLCQPGSALKVRDGFATALYAGTGFQLIKRHVFERMIDAYPDLHFAAADMVTNDTASGGQLYALFDSIIDPATRRYLSEDYSFCQRWRAIGGEIWVDLRSELTHSGVHHFSGNATFRHASLMEAHAPETEPRSEPDERHLTSST